ncbi:cell division cycle 25 homolog d [Hemiscyllium ocellatum]|uniref:cell division cycle 25 homolog d n=1 Tax=Hemiscyllium ocellatum TaxID=170820 RepID=UPI00296661F1|nr:cell division cycle 25 homolog d [Hemiscyllium ocellatum]
MSFSPDSPFFPDLHLSPVSSLSFNLNSLTCQESDTPKRRLKLSPESGNPSPEALPVATDTKTPTGPSPNSPCGYDKNSAKKGQTPSRRTKSQPIRLLDKMWMKVEGNLHQPDKQHEDGCARSGINSSPLTQLHGKRTEQADGHQSSAQKRRKHSNHGNWETDQRQLYNLHWLSCLQEVDVKQIPDSEEGVLIGDFSKACILPMEDGKHQDLKYISAHTVAALLLGEYERVIHEYVIVDCRYPYEYNGGHIKGALNLYSEEQLISTFFSGRLSPCPRKRCRVIIFHCEFSSERGPKFCRSLRRMDRNANVYPNLCFPELYILKNGYKEFFQEFATFCEPRGYIQMHHKDYREELHMIRRKVRLVAGQRRPKGLFQMANGH